MSACFKALLSNIELTEHMTCGAGLLANASGQALQRLMTDRLRQQAGSYSFDRHTPLIDRP
jgi:hypothetical protein